MRIFKSEIKEMKNDGKDGDGTATTADGTTPAAEPLEGRVLREDHAPRTTPPGSTSAERRDV